MGETDMTLMNMHAPVVQNLITHISDSAVTGEGLAICGWDYLGTQYITLWCPVFSSFLGAH